MLPEYDFKGRKAVRGRYYQVYRRGHAVRICQRDGSVTIQRFTPERNLLPDAE
jgi:hypothetical protein